MNKRRLFLNCCIVVFLATGAGGCTASKTTSILAALPPSGTIAGWTTTSDPQTYNKDTIFQLMDGQAEFFFRYGFELVAVGEYQNKAGDILEAEVWQLATTADAYGLFSVNDSGLPTTVGKANEGNLVDQDKLVFWQNRYFVLLRPRDSLPNTELMKFGEWISGALPTGGTRPAIMDRLPAEGKLDRSEIFFHDEMAIQTEVFLGGENILNLGPQIDGAFAIYTIGGEKVRLILIQYPDSAAAAAGLAALQGGQVDNLILAETHDNFLGAVFGNVDRVAVEALLHKALAIP